MPVAGKLGRKPPHSNETHPRLFLEDYLDVSALPTPPNVVDYSTKVTSWPMYMNGPDPQAPAQIRDTGIGDCTFAYVGHAIQAFTEYANIEATVTDTDVLTGYEKVGGYVLGNESTDNGCVIQDVLGYWRNTGIGGHKIAAFAALKNPSDVNLMRQALYIFGSVDVGVNFPSQAMNQFNNGQPWSVVPGDSIEGGHCVALQRFDPTVPDGYYKVITWAQEQPVRVTWWDTYVEEAWIVVSEDFFNQNTQESVPGFNMTQMMADLKDITS